MLGSCALTLWQTKICRVALLHALRRFCKFVLRCKNLYRIGPRSWVTGSHLVLLAHNFNFWEKVKSIWTVCRNQSSFFPFYDVIWVSIDNVCKHFFSKLKPFCCCVVFVKIVLLLLMLMWLVVLCFVLTSLFICLALKSCNFPIEYN